MKLTIEEKLKIAKEHVDEGVPLFDLVKKYNYDITNVKYICALYIKNGNEAFDNHN